MVCSFVDAEKIKEWIDLCQLMKVFDSMVCFKFTEQELTIQMVHVSRYCVLEMKFPAIWFSSYEWRDHEFYIDTESLYTIFSLYSGEKMISMGCEGRNLMIRLFHDDHKKYLSIPIQLQRQSLLNIEPNEGYKGEICPSYLYELCEQLSQFGNTVSILIKPDLFHLSTYRTEKMLIEVNPEKINCIRSAEVDGHFDLYYILLFFKFARSHSKAYLHLSEFLHLSVEKEYSVHCYISPKKS
jgi:hypothetical protein